MFKRFRENTLFFIKLFIGILYCIGTINANSETLYTENVIKN